MFELDGKDVQLADLKVMLENGELQESPWGTGLFRGRQQLIYKTYRGCYGVDGNQLRRKLTEAGLLTLDEERQKQAATESPAFPPAIRRD